MINGHLERSSSFGSIQVLAMEVITYLFIYLWTLEFDRKLIQKKKKKEKEKWIVNQLVQNLSIFSIGLQFTFCFFFFLFFCFFFFWISLQSTSIVYKKKKKNVITSIARTWIGPKEPNRSATKSTRGWYAGLTLDCS